MMRTGLLAAFVGLVATAAQAQTTQAPVEAFGRLPAIADAAISPDGRHIALARNDAQGLASIAIIDVDDPAHATSFSVHEREQLRSVSWADDTHVAYIVSRTFRPREVLPPGVEFVGHPGRVDYWRTGLVDTQSNRSIVLRINGRDDWSYNGAQLIAPIEGDPGFGRMFVGTRRAPALYRVDLNTGRTTFISVNGGGEQTLGYDLDEHGSPLARYDSDEETNHWKIFLYNGQTPHLVMEDTSEYGAPPSIEGLLPDGRVIGSDRPETGGYYTLFIVDRETGERTPFFARDGLDVSNAIRDPWTRRIVGAEWDAERPEAHYFDADLQGIYDHLTALAQGDYTSIQSWSRDRRRFLLYIEHGLDGGGYYIYERGANRAYLVGYRYPELQSTLRGERQSITYRARDGVRIPAYLTYPDVADRHNLPLILLVHGGPHARDDFGFDWWSAFLASRGFAVLQPNYRGSTGYGRAWEEAGRRQWGGLMQTDVEDGVAALVRAGIVDQRRVCIVGASYGGYAALAGATLTPDRYTCAASIAGVSDLNLMLARTEQRTGGDDSMASDWWRLSIGDASADRERIRAVSPINSAERVHIPMLIVHGTDDIVVPIEQSRRMRDRLRGAGKDVTYVELPNDDHWLSDAATRTQMLRELDSFLRRSLPNIVIDDSGAPGPAAPH